jgi:hypothetical protein
LTAPDPTKGPGMAFLTTPDPTAGPVEVRRPSAPGSTGDDLNLCPSYHVGAADSGLVTVTRSKTPETRIPTSRTTPKKTSSRPTTSQSPSHESYCAATSLSSLNHNRLSMIPSNGSRNQSCLSTLGSTEEQHLNLCSMASYDVLAAASPGSAEEGHLNLCPMVNDYVLVAAASPGSAEEGHLNLYPMVNYYVLAAVNPMIKDESCPSLSTPDVARAEGSLNLCPLAMASNYVQAAASPGPLAQDECPPSLSAPGFAAYSPCLLRSSATYPMGSSVSVTQLLHPRLLQPHRRALRAALVLIQEPRVRS